ncbi:baseplate multidomain protein megatron [Pleomorphomonas koreensis]|uniref:baseplate multidomain protein megatron n=1 Tax=Pleomorphomonas koreensis TaxID=257440 RepID=UPI0003F91E4A|nr:glycoside hydrolase TIM-barrel-like domain-containing protein [Pleomorphomonas koreensis]
MAALVLGVAGAAIGGSIGGTILGISAATIGGFVGAAAGSMVDSWIVSSLTPAQRIEGARLDSLRLTSSTEGAVIPRLYGRMRIGGNIIWATDFREESRTTTQGGGKGFSMGGGGAKVQTTEYLYYASFAVALCEGPITGIGRIWADGKLLDTAGIAWRWYPGDENQTADPFIAARMGAADTPSYRGTAYVVFEELPLANYGNRLPQLSFEVFRPLADADTAEGLVRAVTMIPASGEFTYATQGIRHGSAWTQIPANLNALSDTADMVVALDHLQATMPAIESVSLVVAWFGNDLRAGHCQIRPGVELASKLTFPKTWTVNGVSRANAHLVSRDAENRPVYGGTPADFAVVQAIREMKARGLRVTFYPFILMDVPPGNSLPNPYSDNASEAGQPAFPWRGRITCSPAADYAGSVDKTATATSQVAAFFGAATAAQFVAFGDTVLWTGPTGDWGLRRMVLHYAQLAKLAGGVDAFIIGSEMRELTTIRDGAGSYPAVQALRDLAAAVRSILGPGVRISYAADWSEYFGHQPADGPGDVFFHLDPLWADSNIDFIGIDNYMPLSDWRDGVDHFDAQAGWPAIHDRAYLQSNIRGGEGFDWYYASEVDRANQIRTAITDGAAAKPWVFRSKDLRSWWSNRHYDRPGGVESPTPTAWVPQSKPIRFTELGCPAIDRGTNQPNVFVDPKSAESEVPHFSRGWRDDAIQRAYLEATYLWWSDPANNPISSISGSRMVHVPECAAWTWDARPYPFFPELTDVWTDGENWRLGHWLTGRLGAVSLAALVRHLCRRAGMRDEQIDVSGLWGAVEGYVIGALESPRASIANLARHFGFDAVESEGRIRFVMRGRAAVASIPTEAMVAADQNEVLELTRSQETELPQALKWQVARANEDYDAAIVEARRITVEASRISSETFPFAVPLEEAERRCRRALMEAWTGRESAVFRLPPSRLALDPADVIRLDHDGREIDFRLVSVADAESRSIEAIRQDRQDYDLPPGAARPSALSKTVVFGAPEVVILDLPQLTEAHIPHHPLIAAQAQPWPGQLAVFRSPGNDGYELVTAVSTRARIGALTNDLWSGPVSRFDHGNVMIVDLVSGTLESVTDIALLGGANALAVESAPGIWEVLQAGSAELIAPGRYRLTRLLRGQRGTEGAMADPVPAGARVVVLDSMLADLPVTEADLGMAMNWRIGPASKPVSDETYVAQTFTPEGVGLRPFAPVHVEQPWRKARVPGDLTIRWVRRDRSLAADSWNAVEIPMSEASESWQVEILDGATVKRSLTTATTSVVYSAADQSADWGAPLGLGFSLDVRIAQIGQTFGAGAALTTTLWF